MFKRSTYLAIFAAPFITLASAFSPQEQEKARIQQIHADIPPHITGPQRARMLDRMLKQNYWRERGDIYFAGVAGVFRCQIGPELAFEQYFHVVRLKIVDWQSFVSGKRPITYMPQWFLKALTQSIVQFLDLSECRELTLESQKCLKELWLSAGRREQDLILPLPKQDSSCDCCTIQ